MIPIEKLKQVTHIYVHDRCPDGLASAMILKDAFKMLGMNPPITFLTHNTEEHARAGCEVLCSESNDPLPWSRPLFCDIAPYDAYGCQGCLDNGAIVLDHHVGTKEVVQRFGQLGVYADADTEPGVSGAVLAFREVWMAVLNDQVLGPAAAKQPSNLVYRAIRQFAEAIGARDTGATDHPLFQQGQWTSKMLMSRSPEYWLNARCPDTRNGFLTSEPYLMSTELDIGRALYEAHEEAVRQALDQVMMFEVPVGDEKGGVILLKVFQEQASGFRLCSDVAWEIAKQPPHFQGVVAGFYYVVDGSTAAPRLCYSLRGIGGFDVQRFAKANGGNGHKAAAGFSGSSPEMFGGRRLGLNPYDYIYYKLAEHLRDTGKEHDG